MKGWERRKDGDNERMETKKSGDDESMEAIKKKDVGDEKMETIKVWVR
jgi:hypothetical protein